MDLDWALISSLVGGLGLFLLGMGMMTDGLKLAGGYALKQVLRSGTATPARAFVSGFGMTALVQSSSAVTVAVIGFVNARLLDFSRSVWVLFGSNVGTTMTAWIVAMVGFKVKVDVIALPAIGIGALLYLFARGVRVKSLGGALCGLGLLFLGLQMMQQAFGGVEAMIDLSWIRADNPLHLISTVLIGILLTAAMQSSSAALAVVLTAVSSGVLTIEVGAAAVIGANVGTTVTALLAVLKASSNARRLAGAHVIFNLLAAVIAFVLMGVLLSLVGWIQDALKLEGAAVISLALFHTLFNVLGVLAMIPLSARMVAYLKGCFLSQEEQTSRPRYLDKVTAQVPDMAVRAVNQEQQRLLRKLGELVRSYIDAVPGDFTPENRFVVSHLISAINDFIADCSRREMAAPVAEQLQQSLRINTRGVTVIECLRELQKNEITQEELPDVVVGSIMDLRTHIKQLLNRGVDVEAQDVKELTAVLHAFEEQYDRTQAELIKAAHMGEIDMRRMEATTLYLSLMRRVTRQYTKALISICNLDGPVAEAA